MDASAPVVAPPTEREIALLVLRVAVPLWIKRLEPLGQPWSVRAIESAGDDFRRYAADLNPASTHAGEAFNMLSRILAEFSALPGGTQFAGWLWCRTHSTEGRPAESWEAVCRYCVSGRGGLPLTTPAMRATGKAHHEFVIAVRRDGRFVHHE